MQQLSGINVLVYYAPHTMTTDIGLDYNTALHIAAGLGVTYWIFSFIGVAYIDRIGRRPPLIWTAVGCAFCFLAVSPTFHSASEKLLIILQAGLLQRDITPTRAKASLAFFFLYEALFAIAWLPVPWLYAPEIMPLRHRAQSAALSAASDWIFNYLVVQITPISISNIRWRTYIIFFVLNLIFAVTILLFYPETAGRSLEEIDSLFFGDNDRLVVVDKKGKLRLGFRKVRHGDAEAAAPECLDSVKEDGSKVVV
jgi:MFS family permease